MKYVMVVRSFKPNAQRWIDVENKGVTDAKLERLMELPQLHSVHIELRMVVHGWTDEGADQTEDSMKAWALSTERSILAKGDSQKHQ